MEFNSDFDKILSAVEKIVNPPAKTFETEEDDRFWKPKPDKTGTALAVIRFLPGPLVDGEGSLPWVSYWDHGFQDQTTGKWYIENCRTTLGEKDPVAAFNTALWGDQTNNDPNYRVDEREQARRQKRRLHYVSNVYIVSDPTNPANEGKVFLYRYGKKIFEKIIKMMQPDLPTEPKINPFDIEKGANFKLKMVKKGKFPNFDECTFLTQGPLSSDNSELQRIYKSEYSLLELVSSDKFKSYEELERHLRFVLGEDKNEYRPSNKSSSPKPKKEEPKVEEESPPWNEEEDDDLTIFKRLAEED